MNPRLCILRCCHMPTIPYMARSHILAHTTTIKPTSHTHEHAKLDVLFYIMIRVGVGIFIWACVELVLCQNYALSTLISTIVWSSCRCMCASAHSCLCLYNGEEFTQNGIATTTSTLLKKKAVYMFWIECYFFPSFHSVVWYGAATFSERKNINI